MLVSSVLLNLFYLMTRYAFINNEITIKAYVLDKYKMSIKN